MPDKPIIKLHKNVYHTCSTITAEFIRLEKIETEKLLWELSSPAFPTFVEHTNIKTIGESLEIYY
jgi:hypothetical protein